MTLVLVRPPAPCWDLVMTTPDAAAVPDRAPVTLFYSYAHEDEALRDELQGHLTILERRGVIRSWHDRAITAGSDWGHEIDQRLRTADVVLLLISKDFIASDYIFGVELDVAMQRQRSGDAVVVPILLRDVDLQPEDADGLPFVNLLKSQGLPRDWKPVTSWSNRDEAWTNVARGLRETVRVIQDRRTSARSMARAIEPARPAALRTDSPVLARVTEDFTQCIAQANAARGGATVDAAELRRQAIQMIDMPDLGCVLWVDDHPEKNVAEVGALAKLQIEVAAVRSTDEALARLANTAERFHLVISSWDRQAEGPLAGLRGLQAMRAGGHTQPVVFYHGAFDAKERSERAASARAAGAFGEAVMPAELMQLVMTALATAHAEGPLAADPTIAH
jgi:CheY-like chemotaxis protein